MPHNLSTFRVAAAVCLLIGLVCLRPVDVWAQAESGSASIQGVVTDSDHRAVPGATVTITQRDTGLLRTLTTDTRGRYAAPALPVGQYDVEVSLPGFATVKKERLTLAVGSAEQVDLTLPPASVREQVTVEADGPSVYTSDAATGLRVNERVIADLPIRGRNFTEFVQLTPNVVQESDRFGLVISGQRSINSNVAVDGADFNDALQGNQRGGNELAFFFPQGAVREFQVVRAGAGAEVGRTSAGFVNVVTKSGTNVTSGSLFYENRNRQLTSKDAFGRKLNNQQNQFGVSIGGPILRNRLFYFAAAEQNLLRVPFVVQFQPQAAGAVLPEAIKALEGERRGTNNPTATFARIDAVLSPRHTFNVQGTYSRMLGENFNFDSPQQDTAATANFTRRSHSSGIKAGLVSMFGRTTVNEIRAQAATDNRGEDPNLGTAQIVITGLGTLGSDTGRPRAFDTTRYQVTDTLSWMRGRHRLRAGFDVNVNDLRQQRESNIQGRYDFKSLADYNAGKINRYRQTIFAFDPNELFFTGRQKEAAIFLQDQIDLRPRLSLNAGLRWEGQWNPQPTRPNPAIPETAKIPNDLKMWQPRAGLSWGVGEDGRTTVRLSTGYYAARTPANLFQRVFTDNGITTVAVDSKTDPKVLNFVTFPNPLTELPAGLKASPPRVFGFDPSFQNPRTALATASIDRSVGRSLTLSTAFTYARTDHLQRRLDRNLFAPTIDATGMPIYPTTRPNPSIGVLSINESAARARYKALSLTADKRLSNRTQAQVTYTLAKNMDDDSNERNFSRETTLNVFDPGAEWAPSKQDVRHTLTITELTDLPKGFIVSAVLLARSGVPFTPVIGFDTQNDGNDDNDRAIINGRVAGRNSMRQPNFFNLDLRLMKRVTLGGGNQLDLSVELLNATGAKNLNYANDAISAYGTPDAPVATAGQALFAPSTARFGGPRQVQIGLRMGF